MNSILAMDDGHLTPGQKRYIQAKEDAQAAKENAASAQDKLRKSEQDKALQQAADAIDKVRGDFNHKLGWMG